MTRCKLVPMPTPAPDAILRFGDFELDVAGYELRRRGRRVKLGRQAMDVLILLVRRRGELVLRNDIVGLLWGEDVFVDVETGINTAISKIRQALRDAADAPTFVETVPARGYRFVAPVETVVRAQASRPPATSPEPALVLDPPALVPGDGERAPDTPATVVSRARFNGRLVAGTLGLVAAGVVAAVVLLQQPWGGSNGRLTLAVLPFENVGGDPEREYLATGLTQETIASLAQVDPERLSVKGRTWRYRGTTKTAAEIGQELSVDYLVESSIRSEGDRVRVSATLLRVKDQEHVWSASFERQPTSLLGLEQELSTAIAEQVRVRLSPDRIAARLRQTGNTEAYDAYLRARYVESRRTAATNAEAIHLYERATTLDPDYALAWSSLAFTLAGSAINADARPRDVWDRARAAAARAIAANPDLGEAQLAQGYVSWLLDWDWREAERAFRAAIRLDPSDAVAHRTLGHALSQLGRQSEAAAATRRAREIEVLEPMSFAISSQVAFQARDNAQAVEYGRRAILMDSSLWIGYSELAQAYEQTGKTDLAMAALTDAVRFSGGNSKSISLKGYLLGKAGRVTEAQEVRRTLEAAARERYVPPYAMALVSAGLGEDDVLFEWLDKAYTARDVHLIYLPVDPKWDRYRRDPRFAALLRRCGFDVTGSTAH
jgi:TolB-like protein/DNA-binding winged helix-turn-helix (wHTH) protein/Tfp pilus assembly protein PilF